MSGWGSFGPSSILGAPTFRQAQCLRLILLRLEKCPELTEGQMYYVYILKNSKNHLYVGSSGNVNARLERHNVGDGAEFTRRNKDFYLIYTETFSTIKEARRRERQIKGWRREKKENLINFGKPII